MPAQSSSAGTVYYVEFDTAPPLRACLKDGQGDPIELTGADVTISIAFAMPRGTFYTSPRDQIVVRSPVDVDPDQVANKGFVSWTPEPQGSVDEGILSPPGATCGRSCCSTATSVPPASIWCTRTPPRPEYWAASRRRWRPFLPWCTRHTAGASTRRSVPGSAGCTSPWSASRRRSAIG